jgi:hypothetical protein
VPELNVSCHLERVRRFVTIAVVATVGLTGLCILSSPRRSNFKSERALFAGYTNGTIGVIAPTFSTLSTKESATINRWLTGGTNAALFTITNQQVCSIWILPFVSICGAATPTWRETVPLLNAPSFSGIKLQPSQTVTVQVAVVSNSVPWRAEFEYTRDSCSDSLVNGLRMLPEQLRAMATRRPVRVETHFIETETITNRP